MWKCPTRESENEDKAAKNPFIKKNGIKGITIAAIILISFALITSGIIMILNTNKSSIIVVHNANELFNAIKSDSIIKLMPGDYDLSEYPLAITNGEITASQYVSNDNYGDSISIENVTNCKIYSDDNMH